MKTATENIELLHSFFADLAEKIEIPEIQPDRVDIFIRPTDLVKAVKILFDQNWGYLITISAYDTVNEEGTPQIGLLYHFGQDTIICSLRFFLPYERRVVESICPIVPSATVYEREIMELYGIDIIDTPDRTKLLLPDDWPDGIYPMLKSFTSLPLDEQGKIKE